MMQVKKKNPQVMKRWRQSHLVKSTSLKVISTRCAHESDLDSREYLGLEVTIDLAMWCLMIFLDSSCQDFGRLPWADTSPPVRSSH